MSFQIVPTFILLILAVYFDIRYHRIPNWLTFSAMGTGIVVNLVLAGVQGLVFAVTGLLAGFGIFILFYLLKGMGAGDVKLVAAIGAFLGPKDILISALFIALAGGIYAIIIMCCKGFLSDFIKRYFFMMRDFLLTGRFTYLVGEKLGNLPRLYYGIPIAVGTSVVLLKRLV